MTGDRPDERKQAAMDFQHDRSRSDTVMISVNFNSYASLPIFFIIPVCEHETIHTTWVLAVFDFYYHR